MRAYIATRLENWRKHNEVRDRLSEIGVSLTYDWTTHGSVKDTSVERIREVALNELYGVSDATVVIVILPGGRGTHAELGIAVGGSIPCYILAEGSEMQRAFSVCEDTCAFYWCPSCVHVRSIDELIGIIKAKRADYP